MNTYWRRFTTYPPRIAWLLTDYGEAISIREGRRSSGHRPRDMRPKN